MFLIKVPAKKKPGKSEIIIDEQIIVINTIK